MVFFYDLRRETFAHFADIGWIVEYHFKTFF